MTENDTKMLESENSARGELLKQLQEENAMLRKMLFIALPNDGNLIKLMEHVNEAAGESFCVESLGQLAGVRGDEECPLSIDLSGSVPRWFFDLQEDGCYSIPAEGYGDPEVKTEKAAE